ncbi:PIR protein [Plasmodium vivax]|uniref:VIR protein n=1 Tax=Plasmodium vivax TaxID=5855 RepID=A0A564ZUB2_PLAVI|nr:PIR protein [Plasmodium vivax]
MAQTQVDYDFFSEMEDYLVIEDQLDMEKAKEKEEHRPGFCNGLKHESKSITQMISICKDFVKLFNIAKAQYKSKLPSEQIKYHKFLNYWINYNLSVISDFNEIKSAFFKHMKSNSESFDPEYELKDKIKEIDIKYINNMNKLYDLYKHYLDLKTSGEEYQKDTFITGFKEKYNKVLEQCIIGGEYKFCKALEKFREFYENIKSSTTKCYNMCPTLPELGISYIACVELSQMAKIGIRLIRKFYTSSLNGLSIMKSGQHSNLINLISLQYNLRMEEDDDEKYFVMMNILHEFFQYCKENIRNSHLLSFIEEYIDVYYKEKKGVYAQIFADCANTNSKPYCEQYRKFSHEFKEDITLINKGPEIYINDKKGYFKNLAPDDSWIGKARAIFQDSEAMPKNSPTIMSTLVSIILVVFFLYKLTPLSSIFRKEKKKKKIPFFYPEKRIQDINDGNTKNMNARHKRGKICFAYQPT